MRLQLGRRGAARYAQVEQLNGTIGAAGEHQWRCAVLRGRQELEGGAALAIPNLSQGPSILGQEMALRSEHCLVGLCPGHNR